MHAENKVFLASKSPRRRELISQVFENIAILDADVDEPRWQSGQSPESYLRNCLQVKFDGGKDCVHGPKSGALLLVADTIVVLGNEVLGKPLNSADASRMLAKLSGKKHKVLTGLQLGRYLESGWKSITEIVESIVVFKKLTSSEIRNYIRSGEPMDKAGSYGFQARGLQLVSEVQGSYSNIIGLPVRELRTLTEKLLARE